MAKLTGKNAIVTGGSTGIGRAIVTLYAQEGARVAVADVRRAEGEATVAEVRAHGGEAVFLDCDVSSPESMQTAVDAAEQAFGSLQVLTANAGILGRGAGKS